MSFTDWAMQLPRHIPLMAVVRGEQLESVHHGSIAVVDTAGRLRFHAGDPLAMTYTHSTLKPLQILPFARAGGFEHFGFGSRDVALLCASHNGEPVHVDGVRHLLAAAGATPDQLQCGIHVPMVYAATGTRPAREDVFTQLQHNCSGKHAGMLAACRMRSLPVESYLEAAHPVQHDIREMVADFAGADVNTMPMGIDGCSAPNYALPLSAIAFSYARLSSPGPDASYGALPERLFRAMTAHPELVSGTGRHDAALMTAGQGDWLTKVGAEGVEAVGIRSLGLGIAIKIADGDTGDAPRALVAAVVEVLRQLGVLGDALPEPLRRYEAPAIINQRRIIVGRVRPVFRLEAA